MCFLLQFLQVYRLAPTSRPTVLQPATYEPTGLHPYSHTALLVHTVHLLTVGPRHNTMVEGVPMTLWPLAVLWSHAQ